MTVLLHRNLQNLQPDPSEPHRYGTNHVTDKQMFVHSILRITDSKARENEVAAQGVGLPHVSGNGRLQLRGAGRGGLPEGCREATRGTRRVEGAPFGGTAREARRCLGPYRASSGADR